MTARGLLLLFVLPAFSETLQSRILNEDRTFSVALPSGYDKTADRYPVLYLLDGESHFRLMAAVAGFMAEQDRIPPIIVVGIDSLAMKQRTRDLTSPTTVATENRFMPGNGGAEKFRAFLATELIPHIEKTYRTRPYRLLVGHSFGGLFAVETLVHTPTMFNGYVAIDPSLFWNNATVVKEAEAFFARTPTLQADLVFTSSNDAGKVPVGARRLAAALDEKAPVSFRWRFSWLEDETHVSIPLPSFHQGLDFVFDAWHLTNPTTLYDKSGIAAVHRHFREGGRRLSYDRTTPPFTVSLIVAGLIRAGRLDEAGEVVLHDPKNYPAPPNQLDALARAYEARGDAASAARYRQLIVPAAK